MGSLQTAHIQARTWGKQRGEENKQHKSKTKKKILLELNYWYNKDLEAMGD
jgi:hypothetical protein